MRVIGTAGHVDHGKSALVRALTGIDPDRLKEEKERQLTIDLGFAWITLPSGQEVSIVDVPGHEDFIKNMLAGVGGIDLALVVVAADEAVMPQTREHLAILDLLRIPRGLVALTKIDLVEDEAWLALVREEVAETLQGTVLADAPIVPVSAHTGAGIEELRGRLDELLAETPERRDVGRPRLSVDRVFSLSGFGTVVTGTLTDGSFVVDDDVVLLPGRREARIRGMQTNKQDVEVASPGRRLAINLSGIDTDEIRRGDVVVKPGTYQASKLIDVTVRLLPDAPRALTHDQEVEFFVGAAQIMAHVRLIGVYELRPGETAHAQLRLREPVVVAHGDRFILRQPSPSRTIGGGRVLDPTPRRRWPRFKEQTLTRFERLASGRPTDLLWQKLYEREPCTAGALRAEVHMPADEAEAALNRLLAGETPAVRRLADGSLFTAAGWEQRVGRMQHLLQAYHEAFPLRLGMPREELASRLRLEPRVFAAFLDAALEAGLVDAPGGRDGYVRLPSHTVELNPAQRAAVERLLERFRADPYTPPNPTEATEIVGEEVLALLVARGDLIRVSQDVLLLPDVYEEMVAAVRRLIEERGSVTVAEFRDHVNTSRKYAIALLEHLDQRHVTRRVGDTRVLRGG